MAAQLQALPPPGLAIFPHLIATEPTSLRAKGTYMSRSFDITTMDGQPILRIESESMSASHRKHVIDVRSGQKLCTIRKTKWSMSWKYYAETAEDGPHLFDLHSHSGFGGSRSEMVFANAADNGKQTQVEFKNSSFGRDGAVKINGIPVAVVEKAYFKMRKEYHLHVAAGLDMFLVVAVVIVMDDKMRTQAASSAAAAGAGAGAGA